MTAGTTQLVGREAELVKLHACLKAGRNVLIEGPVGVGKTRLASAAAEQVGRPVFRVDGDSRYTEQKLAGWFDPPVAMQKGFGEHSFVPGPLVRAMKAGGILFINELNRMPEGVQNILLPAIDEGQVEVPRLGRVSAHAGFAVVATQNPKEFVATTHLSEALLDRFELLTLGYQSEAEEIEIVGLALGGKNAAAATHAVRVARLTREHPRVRRGASVRAAQAMAELAASLGTEGGAANPRGALLEAALLALPTRIELERDEGEPADSLAELIRQWVDQAFRGEGGKKKP